MKKFLVVTIFVFASILVLSPVAHAEGMFLESTDGLQIQTCDHFHHVESCAEYHITVEKSTGVGPGTMIRMDDQKARIDWAGEGFKLADGTVISKQATGTWEQVWPSFAPVQVSSWQDLDNNSYLTVSDQVTVNGSVLAVKDHRYFIWVTPMP